MSTRCTISYAGPIHIYECVNTYDKNDDYEICIAGMEEQYCSEESYNRDAIIGRENLFKIYQQLEKYFTPDLKKIAELGFDINKVNEASQLFKDIEKKMQEHDKV